jgi:hypothetical protein
MRNGKKVRKWALLIERSTMNSAKSIQKPPKTEGHKLARKEKRIQLVAQFLEDVDQENLPDDGMIDFEDRLEMAAELIDERGWPQLRDNLAELGVAEESLPIVSPKVTPTTVMA